MSQNHRAARIVHLTGNDHVVHTSSHDSMADDDDNNKAGLIDIPMVAINNTDNSDGDVGAAPNAEELIEAAWADRQLSCH
jgi:hypothetical protein